MNKLLFLLLLLPSIGLSQITYKSIASHYYHEYATVPYAVEWMKREIKIDENTLTVVSYGKENTDIQTWRIQSIEENIDTESANTVYYVDLASGEAYEYPASFTVQFDKDDKVETITCVIPPNKHLNLPKDSPTMIRFIID